MRIHTTLSRSHRPAHFNFKILVVSRSRLLRYVHGVGGSYTLAVCRIHRSSIPRDLSSQRERTKRQGCYSYSYNCHFFNGCVVLPLAFIRRCVSARLVLHFDCLQSSSLSLLCFSHPLFLRLRRVSTLHTTPRSSTHQPATARYQQQR